MTSKLCVVVTHIRTTAHCTQLVPVLYCLYHYFGSDEAGLLINMTFWLSDLPKRSSYTCSYSCKDLFKYLSFQSGGRTPTVRRCWFDII